MPKDSFAKYEAEVVIRMYSEPKREDFPTEDAYLKAVDAWVDDVEERGDRQLAQLFEETRKEV